ncbi:hypothetical protein BTVI_113692 [Pitangus sulphuratus]|nr:hypothetical protein BTVI_113692 [Pitangus sulphuratus]
MAFHEFEKQDSQCVCSVKGGSHARYSGDVTFGTQVTRTTFNMQNTRCEVSDGEAYGLVYYSTFVGCFSPFSKRASRPIALPVRVPILRLLPWALTPPG